MPVAISKCFYGVLLAAFVLFVDCLVVCSTKRNDKVSENNGVKLSIDRFYLFFRLPG